MRPIALAAALVPVLVLSSSSVLAAAPGAAREVRMTDVSYFGAQDLSSGLAAGPARVALPFGVVWDGARYEALEIGPGWARLAAAGEIVVGSGLVAEPRSIAPRGVEARAGGREARFDLFPFPVALGASARVLLVQDASRLALRWLGLEASGTAAPLAAELLLERGGRVRLQYLQVRGLPAGTEVAGSALRNGLALEVVPPGERLIAHRHDDATGPPPPGCVAPTETWCEQADGPGTNSIIFLDSRFEETPPIWTTSGPPAPPWSLITATQCPPGATTNPGQSGYSGDPTLTPCSYAGAFQTSLIGPLVGPVTPTTKLSFSARMQFPYPADQAEILINGTAVWYLDPTGLDPNSWYSFLPLTVPAPFVGQMISLSFRFSSSGSAVGQLGWMVDDVFLWDDNGAQYKCVREARYNNGAGTPYADCSDTVHDDWSFNETEFCVGCTYTFYALVECGTEMHLPLWDMEGAEITVTDMITGTRPSLTCANQAQRTPPGPIIYQRDCCPTTPGNESWTGPAFTATDSGGPGSVAWGFPSCSDLSGAYDLDGDGIECSELSPACGGVLSRLSPGEGQGMDCAVAGSPGLCGIYRIDVRSGGFVWNLYANCTGDTTPNFRLYSSCPEAWTAFNPLPEIAVASVRETGTCPNTEIEYTLQNVGCSDHTGDIALRAESNCPTPDVVSWTLTGGLPANGSRTERQAMTVSCTGATVTVFVDPGNLIPECSESGSAAACKVIPGSDSTTVSVCGCSGTVPPVPTATQVCSGLATDLSCGTPLGGATYDWDFEDDGSYDASGCNQSHVYTGPGPFTARVRLTESGGCRAESTVAVTLVPDDPAVEPALVLGAKSPTGIHFQWAAVAKAVTYRVARGTIKNFWDHTVDDTLGIGLCDTATALVFDDPDDLSTPGSFYYLVAPVSNCGTDSPWGNGADAVPPPLPSASCP